MNYLTYSYLLTPLHTGASTQAGNLLGIAREAQTELPYIPSSSLRGKLRSSLESMAEIRSEAGSFFGERIKDGQQPTEGEVWFADATLLFFPVGSFSHQFLWITCPLWLSRWGRWLRNDQLNKLIEQWQSDLLSNGKKAITSASGKQIYLQGAILNEADIKTINNIDWNLFKDIPDGNGILDLKNKLVILSNEDCGALVEIGLQREVRIALDENEKIVAGGSFRSEEAIPSETIMFFPWGMKLEKEANKTHKVRESLINILNDRLQFGGLEGLGRGWTENKTIAVNKKEE
ncbi:type III-B CRISPR module RAMP protein Cmr4 [Cylindrospermopsis raciborskii]|uniref:Type III-B CRISPR module RAMP protein Cmr4 n=1 Tax=Cylindrospermopsis raciborskii CENA303 TaxID=1170769 RepID=A0A1X4G621_9CYAN|nr:type III-B CRISPR module RAMP protein Cmr4 [Cylindrospermopsis raciborskii]MCZ2207517.1 type III-B CRISPR module RAMP protein Cmr4 [Cylindrospermopsis raciborskii PAMP2011]OSO90044.1 type III-B CRISPR module RAMP protein Cmr4 [Cylindrospermopsis raciborskii CENA303]